MSTSSRQKRNPGTNQGSVQAVFRQIRSATEDQQEHTNVVDQTALTHCTNAVHIALLAPIHALAHLCSYPQSGHGQSSSGQGFCVHECSFPDTDYR